MYLLALQTDSLCQGRSASSQSWETPLFPHFMCKRAVRNVPLPAHLGSTTLHMSPDTEITVM